MSRAINIDLNNHPVLARLAMTPLKPVLSAVAVMGNRAYQGAQSLVDQLDDPESGGHVRLDSYTDRVLFGSGRGFDRLEIGGSNPEGRSIILHEDRRLMRVVGSGDGFHFRMGPSISDRIDIINIVKSQPSDSRQLSMESQYATNGADSRHHILEQVSIISRQIRSDHDSWLSALAESDSPLVQGLAAFLSAIQLGEQESQTQDHQATVHGVQVSAKMTELPNGSGVKSTELKLEGIAPKLHEMRHGIHAATRGITSHTAGRTLALYRGASHRLQATIRAV